MTSQAFPDEAPTRPSEPLKLAEVKERLRRLQRSMDTTMVSVERSVYGTLEDAWAELDELLAKLEEGGAA